MKTKPFIKPFKTANKYYFYDANINQIVSVSYETYNELNNSEIDIHYNNEIFQLYQLGYLHENPIEILRHSMTDSVEDLIGRRLNVLVLQVTKNCNLSCSYCPYAQSGEKQRIHMNENMTWEVAKKSVDFYYEHTIDLMSAFISFYGGEPLINFELIKQVVDYSKIKFEGKNITFSVTTNATLLDDKKIDYFVKINYYIKCNT